MFYTIFKFELLRHLKSPVTYLYFAIITLCSTVAVNFIYENALGPVKENAPYVIASTMTISYAFMLMITSMLMGMSVMRDFQHQIAGILFSKPISKIAYLGGRFLGAFLIMIILSSGLLWGVILGEYLPWRSADNLLPFQFWNYLQAYLYLVLPTLFFSSALFFVSGTLSRKLIVVYTQGILLLIAYIISMIAMKEMDNSFLGAMLDPFSFNTIKEVIRHWTPLERNTTVLPFSGLLLYNRILWTCVGIIILFWGYQAFSFDVIKSSNSLKKNSAVNLLPSAISTNQTSLPPFKTSNSIKAQWQKLYLIATFHAKAILRETSFWAIVICAVSIILVNSISVGTSYGVDSLPLTYLVIEELSELSGFFFLIILVFFSGEVIWKERDHKMSLVTDTLPISSFIVVSGKFLGLMGIYTILVSSLVLSGILFQLSSGYTHLDLPVYGIHLLLNVLLFLGLYTIASFLFQALCNHKFIGHTLLVIFFLIFNILAPFGLDHPLYTFNAGSVGTYSEINGFGHFLKPYFYHKGYWVAISVLLLITATLFTSRGTETKWSFRIKAAKNRLSKPIIKLAYMASTTAILLGGNIFYQTNILADFSFPNTELAFRADYEKLLKQYQYIVQPKIIDVTLKLDIFPEKRSYTVDGEYILVNKDTVSISTIHIQEQPTEQIEAEHLSLSRAANLNKEHEHFGYHIYQLKEALLPGDSLKLHFKQHFTSQGFEQHPVTELVANGSFFKNDHFPTLGYNSNLEIREHADRQLFGLPKKGNKRPQRNDPNEVKHATVGDDGYEIQFEAIVSTDIGQTAIAPGHLSRQWTEGSRAYFEYQMKSPMINFYPFLSADYEVMKEQWVSKKAPQHQSVDFEIYYHKAHNTNLDRMMNSLHLSMDYFTAAFGPYGYDHLRIVEFPRYVSYAQSFPGVIAYSENLGFVLDINDEEDVDMVFFITAHELAHQWWGLQLAAANVEGRNMLLESLAQYSALMVLKQHYPQDKVDQFLKRERDRYLEGRTKESVAEYPLARVQSQKYLHYGKGAVNLYTLQDYISQEKLNLALKQFIKDWNIFSGPKQIDRYPTTADLMTYFQAVTPDSLQYVLTDLFETITFYKKGISSTEIQQLPAGQYSVSVKLDVQKIRLDSIGTATVIPINDLLDIGIYDSNDSLRQVKKYWIKSQNQILELETGFEVGKVVIDPKEFLFGI